jgi:hypothetical protein
MEFMSKFSITDLDSKFLRNPDLSDIAYFLVYNLLYLFSIRNYSDIELIQNEFSRLKALDIFFNLCLIIDETLKVAYKKANGKLLDRHYLSDGLVWLVESNGWMTKSGDLQDFWGKQYLNVNENDPDVVIPKLLGKTLTETSASFSGGVKSTTEFNVKSCVLGFQSEGCCILNPNSSSSYVVNRVSFVDVSASLIVVSLLINNCVLLCGCVD